MDTLQQSAATAWPDGARVIAYSCLFALPLGPQLRADSAFKPPVPLPGSDQAMLSTRARSSSTQLL
jgi:hypothetical protein